MAEQVTQDGSGVVINASVDQLLEGLPIGSVQKAIFNNLYGINARQTGGAVPRAKDSFGFTFFTRPQLNMTQFNLTNYRGFYNLLTDNDLSYQRYTRMMLDPRLGAVGGLKSPLVNNESAFIPILTNNIVSVSGWPDLSVPVYTSPSGLYGQEHSIVDGVTNHFEAFDIDVTFKNTKGNPLIYFFYIWIKYQTLVFEGILNPYLDMITENEIDYNTRIYRLVLDQQKRYVTFIAATGASFPVNVPTGNLFDYNLDTPFNTRNSEINIRFRSLGFTAFEDILKLEFNQTSAIFNADLKNLLKHDMSDGGSDADKAREDGAIVYKVPGCSYVKVPYLLSSAMDSDIGNNSFFNPNYHMHPYINMITNELEWWVDEKRFGKNSQDNVKNNAESNGINSGSDLFNQAKSAASGLANAAGAAATKINNAVSTVTGAVDKVQDAFTKI